MPKKDGPKSVADLTIVPMLPGVGRPDAPSDLTKIEREIWKSTVDAMPLRWFGGEQWELLRVYCCHCAMAHQLAERWRLNGYSRELADQYEQQTNSIGKLAKLLRLAKLGRYERGNQLNKDEAAFRNTPKKRLWEE